MFDRTMWSGWVNYAKNRDLFRGSLGLFMTFIAVLYLVFKSNARIAIPLVFILPIMLIMMRSGRFEGLRIKNFMFVCSAVVLGLAIFFVVDFRSFGLLGFDFNDPFSGANTQGRNVIWAALLDYYSNAELVNQLIGLGFSADIQATWLYSESVSLRGARAHNSYLYMLLCYGLLGGFIFYAFLVSAYLKISQLFRKGEKMDKIIAMLSASFLIMFLWFSLTTEIIIRPQLMILMFYFFGLAVQRSSVLASGRSRRVPVCA